MLLTIKLIAILKVLNCLIYLSNCQLTPNQTVEQTLVTTLLNGYEAKIRPSELVEVSIAVQLKQIVGIDEKNQVMTSSCYIEQWWEDSRLAWNQSHYNDIQVINLLLKNIWAPDTNILNSANGDGYFKINADFSYVNVKYTGEVYFVTPALSLQTKCALNVTKYPFDSQTCSIILSTWSFSSNKVTYLINDTYIDTYSDYTPHNVWEVSNSSNIVPIDSSDRNPYEGNYYIIWYEIYNYYRQS